MLKNLIKKTTFYKKWTQKKLSKNLQLRNNAIIAENNEIRGPLVDKYLPKNGVGAELGVLKGHFSRTLLESTMAKELHLIDPWYFLAGEWAWLGSDNSTIDAVCSILQEFKREIIAKKIFVHIEDDLKVLNSFDDNFLDWAYIDSSHSYEHTQKELKILFKKVKQKGIICGDDWRPNPKHRHHGVYKAVNEFMVENNFELIYANDQNLQWFIKRAQ